MEVQGFGRRIDLSRIDPCGFFVMWALYALSSGVFNALWTSRIKSKVQTEGAFPFTASVRWGVVILLLPFALWQWHPVSARWWFFTALSGILESLNVWTLSKGARKDYYSCYALSNTSPFFAVFLASFFLGEKVDWSLAAGVGLVIAGVLWLYYRGHWSWWGVGAAFVGATGNLFSKMVIAESGPIPHAVICFAAGAMGSTLASYWTGYSGTFRRLPKNIWSNRFLSFFSFLGTLTFYGALYLAPLSRVSPLFRINMVAGFFLSVFVLQEKRDWKGRGIGAILLLSGLILVLWK